jgi:hypothetical protein
VLFVIIGELSTLSEEIIMASSIEFIQKAYIAFFNRPADKDGFDFWCITDDSDQALLDRFAQSAEYLSDFAGKNNREIIQTIYKNLFGRDPELEGWNYWEGQMNAGWVTVGNAAYEILRGAQGTDKTKIDNKVTAAQQFTGALDTDAEIDAYALAGENGVGHVAKDWLSGIANGPNLVVNLSVTLGNLNNILTILLNANSGITPPPAPVTDVHVIDSSKNESVTLSTEDHVSNVIKWDNTFGVSKLTVLGFDASSTTLDFTAYGASWLGAATLNSAGFAIDGFPPKSYWNSDSSFPGASAVAGDTYITLTRAGATDATYKVELWQVGGKEADAYYGGSLPIPALEARDTAQLIGYVDLGCEIDLSVIACIDF